MPEPESKDPKEESSSTEESDQNESNSSPEEDAGNPDENAPEEQKSAPTGRSGLVRHIVLGVLLVAALAGLWQDQKARRELDAAAEDLMFRLKGMRNFDDNDVHAQIGRAHV